MVYSIDRFQNLRLARILSILIVLSIRKVSHLNRDLNLTLALQVQQKHLLVYVLIA
jgi:hypothetical protein